MEQENRELRRANEILKWAATFFGAELELATLGWVHWHNNQRLHGYLGEVSPVQFEEAFYAGQRSDRLWLNSNSPSLHQTQGDSPG